MKFTYNTEKQYIDVFFTTEQQFMLDVDDMCKIVDASQRFVYDENIDVQYPVSVVNGVNLFRFLYPKGTFRVVNGNKKDLRKSNIEAVFDDIHDQVCTQYSFAYVDVTKKEKQH